MGDLGAVGASGAGWKSVPSGGRAAGNAPGWSWLTGNPIGKDSGSYSHKPVDSVDQFSQPTPLYLLLFPPWK